MCTDIYYNVVLYTVISLHIPTVWNIQKHIIFGRNQTKPILVFSKFILKLKLCCSSSYHATIDFSRSWIRRRSRGGGGRGEGWTSEMKVLKLSYIHHTHAQTHKLIYFDMPSLMGMGGWRWGWQLEWRWSGECGVTTKGRGTLNYLIWLDDGLGGMWGVSTKNKHKLIMNGI